MMPRITVYRAADRGFALGLNRYPSAVIGAYLRVGHRVLGLQWRRP